MLIAAITLERVSLYYHIIVVVLLLYGRGHHIIIAGRLKWLPAVAYLRLFVQHTVSKSRRFVNTNLIARRIAYLHNTRKERYDNEDSATMTTAVVQLILCRSGWSNEKL